MYCSLLVSYFRVFYCAGSVLGCGVKMINLATLQDLEKHTLLICRNLICIFNSEPLGVRTFASLKVVTSNQEYTTRHDVRKWMNNDKVILWNFIISKLWHWRLLPFHRLLTEQYLLINENTSACVYPVFYYISRDMIRVKVNESTSSDQSDLSAGSVNKRPCFGWLVVIKI